MATQRKYKVIVTCALEQQNTVLFSRTFYLKCKTKNKTLLFSRTFYPKSKIENIYIYITICVLTVSKHEYVKLPDPPLQKKRKETKRTKHASNTWGFSILERKKKPTKLFHTNPSSKCLYFKLNK